MKLLMTIAAISLLLLLSAPSAAQQNTDSTAIEHILREEVAAWNKGDALTYSKHFAANGTFTNIRGMFFTGYQGFLDRHAEIFKGMFAGSVLSQAVASFRFLAPDVAVVETLTSITGFNRAALPKGINTDEEGRLNTRLLQVFQKQAGVWKVVVYHNVDIKADVPVPPRS